MSFWVSFRRRVESPPRFFRNLTTSSSLFFSSPPYPPLSFPPSFPPTPFSLLSVLGPIPLQQRNELINHLAGWSYRPYVLSQDDLFRCNCLLFEATLSIEGIWELDIDQGKRCCPSFQAKTRTTLTPNLRFLPFDRNENTDQIKRFLFSVKSLYHSPNPYHVRTFAVLSTSTSQPKLFLRRVFLAFLRSTQNYTHGSDVLQATYSFLVALGVAPPISTLLGTKGTRPAQPWKRPSTTHGRAAEVLRPQDVLTLMIAAIGHDGAHPGLSNAFLVSARAFLRFFAGRENFPS